MCNKELETCKKQLATHNKKVESYRKQVETQGLQMQNMKQKLDEVYGMLKLLPTFPDLDNVASTFAPTGTFDKQPSSSPSPFMDEDHYLPVMDDLSFDTLPNYGESFVSGSISNFISESLDNDATTSLDNNATTDDIAHSSTDDNIVELRSTSKGNHNILNFQSEPVTQRRSGRVSKLPTKLLEYVLDEKRFVFVGCHGSLEITLPNSLSIAYFLALLEEISYNFMKKISVKLNESNKEKKDSDGLLVLNDDCKETESRVRGMYADNELVVNVMVETIKESFKGKNRLVNDVRCDEVKLKVSKMDDNSNSKELEKESVESAGYEECCEENVEGLGIETKESVDNNECLKKFDKFVNGNDMNKKEITRGNKIAYHKIGTKNIRLKSYAKSYKEDVIGNEIECLGLISPIKLDEELNGLVELKDKNKCLGVTDNLVNKKDETKSENKRMGLSSLICSGEIIDGAKGRERNEINVSSLVNECDVVMNSNKGYWTSNFNKPVDIIKECSVEQKEDVGLEIQTVVAITETLPCSLPTIVGANEHIICPNEGGIQNGVCLFGRCCNLKNVKGLIDKKKGCNKADNRFDVCNTNPESSIKSTWNRLFNDQKLASGFNANKIATTDVGMNLEKEVASDITTVDVLNSESYELTKVGLESVQQGKGLIVSMVGGVEGNN
nr:hypothetical protein [Tanacetum cinerariifolium]